MDDTKTYQPKRIVDIKDNSNIGEGIYLPPEVLSLLSPYFDQNLKKQVSELQEKIRHLNEKYEKTNEAFISQGIELYAIKAENERLVAELQKYGNNDSEYTEPAFKYFIDERHFKGANIEWITSIWNGLHKMVNSTGEKGMPIIENAIDLVPIYQCMTDASVMPYPFTGSREDWVYSWNRNIQSRITDPKRKEKLKAKTGSLNAAINKDPWKNVDPTSWYRLAQNGDSNSTYYANANILKKEITSFAKPIICE